MRLEADILLTSSDLTNYGVPLNTIKNGVFRNNKGLITSWQHTTDRSDRRKVLIFRDSIPPKTRKKYNIPTSEELEIRAVSEQEQEKDLLAEKTNKSLFKRQKNAVKKGYKSYLNDYVKAYGDRPLVLKEKAGQHSLYAECLRQVNEGLTIERVFEIYDRIKHFNKPCTHLKTFYRHMKRAQKEGVRSVIIHATKGKRNAAKFSDFHKALSLIYASNQKKYPIPIITDMVNFHCEEKGQAEVSYSTVKTYLREPKIKNLIEGYRHGEKSLDDTVLPFMPRKEEQFAGNLWVMDGTPVGFFCQNGKSGKARKLIRLNLYVIIDAFSKKIVGFDVSLSEDRFNVIHAIKMALTLEGHLPMQIQHDNFSANKTEELKEIKDKLKAKGVTFRAINVGNSKDNTAVERYFGTFQSLICRLHDGYVGEGIRSKRKDGRPSPEQSKVIQKASDLTIDQMKEKILCMVSQYNNLTEKGKKSPVERYRISPKPNVVKVDNYELPFLFWNRTRVTVRRSMVVLTLRGLEHFFELPDSNLKMSLNGAQVNVFYDEKDLEKVHLFTDRDEFICECRKIIRVANTDITRDEQAAQVAHKHASKRKKYKKDLKETLQEEIEKGLKEVGI